MGRTTRSAGPQPRFELTGGALCLDFANTVEKRLTSEPEDHLGGWDDLVAWGVQTGLVSRAGAGRLRRQERPGPQGEREILERARALREALFRIFSSIAAGGPAPEEALDLLNAWVPRALGSLRLGRSPGRYGWEWTDRDPPAERILHRVVDSAAELLTSSGLDRVRECRSETCAWLFIDTSRNRTRQWCDMAVCGNRAKARRHYLRSRGAAPRNKRPRDAV